MYLDSNNFVVERFIFNNKFQYYLKVKEKTFEGDTIDVTLINLHVGLDNLLFKYLIKNKYATKNNVKVIYTKLDLSCDFKYFLSEPKYLKSFIGPPQLINVICI